MFVVTYWGIDADYRHENEKGTIEILGVFNTAEEASKAIDVYLNKYSHDWEIDKISGIGVNSSCSAFSEYQRMKEEESYQSEEAKNNPTRLNKKQLIDLLQDYNEQEAKLGGKFPKIMKDRKIKIEKALSNM